MSLTDRNQLPPVSLKVTHHRPLIQTLLTHDVSQIILNEMSGLSFLVLTLMLGGRVGWYGTGLIADGLVSVASCQYPNPTLLFLILGCLDLT